MSKKFLLGEVCVVNTIEGLWLFQYAETINYGIIRAATGSVIRCTNTAEPLTVENWVVDSTKICFSPKYVKKLNASGREYLAEVYARVPTV